MSGLGVTFGNDAKLPEFRQWLNPYFLGAVLDAGVGGVFAGRAGSHASGAPALVSTSRICTALPF